MTFRLYTQKERTVENRSVIVAKERQKEERNEGVSGSDKCDG
jgi:hypothetical protein